MGDGTTLLDDFYLTPAALDASPSRVDGVSAAEEAALRAYGCGLVADGAVLLRAPQAAAATAQVLLHRFYCKESLARFSVKVGLGCWRRGGEGVRRLQFRRRPLHTPTPLTLPPFPSAYRRWPWRACGLP